MSAQRTVPTPASRRPVPTAVVIGAGVAGLTAAHELVERGFEVTVYEPKVDERAQFDSASGYPPVKLGGLAASQFSTTGAAGGRARLRPFPGRRGSPRPPERAVAGEHGYRFFPAYYLHLGDLLERIPVYEPGPAGGPAGTGWSPTCRTVMDNMRRVVAQATTVGGKPSLIFPREAPRTLAEMLTATNQLAQLGFSPTDMSTFSARLLRYLVTSPLRRAAELEHVSAYDFFLGQAAGKRQFGYTPSFESFILAMPKVLAAFDSRWGDARTNLTTYLQLQMQMSRDDNKADGVLNGPTSESWFDHWYRHLARLGVRFVLGAAHRLEPPRAEAIGPAHLRPRATVVLADGTRLTPDYVVVAADAPTAEAITAPLRAAGTGGTVVGLDGFTTSVAPPAGPLQDGATRPKNRRDPLDMSETGRVPWDRFQTLAGIQYYFDTEFQLLRGHMYYSGSDWGLSSINQQGLWERRPLLARDGHVSVLSVDIGDFNTPSRHLLDANGHGKAARDCTADELAAEVWRQIAAALTSDVDNDPDAILPTPVWYALDRNLVLTGAGEGTDRPIRNEAPYLVPIVGDWSNRPDGEPWNPNGSSWITRPTEEQWLEDLDQLHVWQARHGGYQVHHNSVVFAGTWTKTFTRMT
ncbi:MAG: oxidoreductase, partial [Streptosporangiaceae bacterium]|nr:oxidoreductase [Streptosporangiaceae bacterium]